MCEVCGGDCTLCTGNYDVKPVAPDPLFKEMIDRVEDIGRARQKLKSILDTEMFDNLSKHNPYWESKDEEMSEKLYDIRMSLACLNDNLWDLWAILNNE